jgi:hypothetical protein
MSYPVALTSLTEREAITDALYRAMIGFDNYDVSVFNSAWSELDATIDVNGDLIYGLADIRAQLLDFVGPMDTTHTVSNVRVDIKDGASTASLTANVLAQHCPPGRGGELNGPNYLAGSRHFLDLVKSQSDGLWKIKKWTMKAVWGKGDGSVMQRGS